MEDAKTQKLKFVLTVYGNDYIGFMLVTIYSIRKSNSEAEIIVYWSGIDTRKKDVLMRAFPEVRFVETEFPIGLDFIQMISSKVILWNRAIQELDQGNVCFIDSDTLIKNEIAPYFEKAFDVAITDKPSEWFPLNTGVILVKVSNRSKSFFEHWRDRTEDILNDSEMFQQANSNQYHYGGADQMAMAQMIGYEVGREVFRGGPLGALVKTYPCALLNETRSVPTNGQTVVYHYKGGWRDILGKGRRFSKNRPKKTSFPMYLQYLQLYQEAVGLVQRFSQDPGNEDWGIKFPFYLDTKTFTESRTKYLLFWSYGLVSETIAFLGKRLRQGIKRCLAR